MYNSQDYKRCICQKFKMDDEIVDTICPYEYPLLPDDTDSNIDVTDTDPDETDDILEDTDTDTDTEPDAESVTDPDQSQILDSEEKNEEETTEASTFLPSFINFDPQDIYEVVIGEELVVKLPSIMIEYNEFGEMVYEPMPSVNLSKVEEKWIQFNSESHEFILKPVQGTKLGLTSLRVTLQSQFSKAEYPFNFFVIEDFTQVGVETKLESEEEIDNNEPESNSEDNDQVEPAASNNSQEIVQEKIEENLDQIKQKSTSIEQRVVTKFSLQDWIDKQMSLKQKARDRLSQLTPQEIKEIETPKAAIKRIDEQGKVKIVFDQAMDLDAIFSNYTFASISTTPLDYQQSQDLYRSLRSLEYEQTVKADFDLSDVMKIEIIRSDEEQSAPQSMLGYEVIMAGFDDKSIEIKLTFQNPLSVSIGKKRDIIRVTFVDPELFISKETGMSLNSDKQSSISKRIPRQFPDQSSLNIIIGVKDTVLVAATTAFLSSFVVTIFFGISLQAMWNLMHVMQVITYLKYHVEWPANTSVILDSMHNAITLEEQMNQIYDYFFEDIDFQVDFEDQEESDQDDDEIASLEKFDIEYSSMFLSLGIFLITLILIIFTLGIYYLLKRIQDRFSTVKNAWIRYMIESTFQMVHNSVFLIYFTGSFDDLEKSINTGSRIFILTIFIVWPFYVIVFLQANKEKLEQSKFSEKFISMYQNQKLKNFGHLLYISVFCFRRLILVLALILLHERQLQLILVYNGLQTFYFWYMIICKPFVSPTDNMLEQFNELCMIFLQYMMIFFIGDVDPLDQWKIGFVAMAVIILIFLVNLSVLVYLNGYKLRLLCKKQSVKVAHKKSLSRSNRSKQEQSSNKVQNLNTQQNDDDDGGFNDAIVDEANQFESDRSLFKLEIPKAQVNIVDEKAKGENSLLGSYNSDSEDDKVKCDPALIKTLNTQPKKQNQAIVCGESDSQLLVGHDGIFSQLNQNSSMKNIPLSKTPSLLFRSASGGLIQPAETIIEQPLESSLTQVDEQELNKKETTNKLINTPNSLNQNLNTVSLLSPVRKEFNANLVASIQHHLSIDEEISGDQSSEEEKKRFHQVYLKFEQPSNSNLASQGQEQKRDPDELLQAQSIELESKSIDHKSHNVATTVASQEPDQQDQRMLQKSNVPSIRKPQPFQDKDLMGQSYLSKNRKKNQSFADNIREIVGRIEANSEKFTKLHSSIGTTDQVLAGFKTNESEQRQLFQNSKRGARAGYGSHRSNILLNSGEELMKPRGNITDNHSRRISRYGSQPVSVRENYENTPPMAYFHPKNAQNKKQSGWASQ